MPRESLLPQFVAPTPGTEYFDARSMRDVERLHGYIINSHSAIRTPVLCAILHTRLLQIGGLTGLASRIALWIAKRRFGTEAYAGWMAVLTKHPEVADEVAKALTRHMLHGRDLEDPLSAGGFSQREITFIANILHNAREASIKEAREKSGRLVSDPLDRIPTVPQ